jgi:hypothetical protein
LSLSFVEEKKCDILLKKWPALEDVLIVEAVCVARSFVVVVVVLVVLALLSICRCSFISAFTAHRVTLLALF